MITTKITMGSGSIQLGISLATDRETNNPIFPVIHMQELCFPTEMGSLKEDVPLKPQHTVLFYMTNEETIKIFEDTLQECRKLLREIKGGEIDVPVQS